MQISKLFRKNAVPVDVRSTAQAQRRHVITRRLYPTGATFVSPIERWEDHNYKPYELDYLYTQKTDLSEIVAPLHGFQPQDVHIDITRGHVLILLSDDEDIAFGMRQEYYCEVPLPANANLKEAYLEISSSFLTVRVGQKQSLARRAASLACRFKLGWQCYWAK